MHSVWLFMAVSSSPHEVHHLNDLFCRMCSGSSVWLRGCLMNLAMGYPCDNSKSLVQVELACWMAKMGGLTVWIK